MKSWTARLGQTAPNCWSRFSLKSSIWSMKGKAVWTTVCEHWPQTPVCYTKKKIRSCLRSSWWNALQHVHTVAASPAPGHLTVLAYVWWLRGLSLDGTQKFTCGTSAYVKVWAISVQVHCHTFLDLLNFMHTPFAKSSTLLLPVREFQNPCEAFRRCSCAECSVNTALFLVHPDLRGQATDLCMV